MRIQSLSSFDAPFRAAHLAKRGNKKAHDAAHLPADAGMAEVVLTLADHGCATLSGHECLDRQSLDTMLFRAWLFGILTFLETRMRELIRGDPDWRDQISEGRLGKARELKEERARRGRAMETVDALQFGDLGWLAVQYDGWYQYFGVESKRQAKQLVKKLEVLRNALAHGGDILEHDWDTVVAVARSVVAIKQAEQVSSE
jgi:hypothetical protein